MGICLVMIIVVVCGIYFYLSPLYERELLKNEKIHVENLVDSAHSLINDYYNRYRSGEFDEMEAQRLALERLKKIRYRGTGYFWVNDLTPTMLGREGSEKLQGLKRKAPVHGVCQSL